MKCPRASNPWNTRMPPGYAKTGSRRGGKKFAVPSLRTGRIPKTLQEQASDLLIAVNNLKVFELVRTQQRTHLVGYLAAELRSLVFWVQDDQRDGGYNPLLLRMASKADLPLPVFAWKKSLQLTFRRSPRQFPGIFQRAGRRGYASP